MPRQSWTECETEQLKALYQKADVEELLAVFPKRSIVSIYKKAMTAGLKRNLSTVRKKYSMDTDFFDTASDQSDYWAGFIAADGNIRSNKPCVRIKISAMDISHLQLFQKQSGSTSPIKTINISENKKYAYTEVHGACKWCESLLQTYNIGPKKSLSYQYPNLELRRAMVFLKGYIDGDGCMHKGETPGQDRFVLCGNMEFLMWARSEVYKYFGLETCMPRTLTPNTYQWAINGTKARLFCSLMSDLTPLGMTRKWDKFNEKI
jgi:hypothetical protein